MTIYKYLETLVVTRISIKRKTDYNSLSDPTQFNQTHALEKRHTFCNTFSNKGLTVIVV